MGSSPGGRQKGDTMTKRHRTRAVKIEDDDLQAALLKAGQVKPEPAKRHVRLTWPDDGEVRVMELVEVDDGKRLDECIDNDALIVRALEDSFADLAGDEYTFELGEDGMWYEVNNSQTPVRIEEVR